MGGERLARDPFASLISAVGEPAGSGESLTPDSSEPASPTSELPSGDVLFPMPADGGDEAPVKGKKLTAKQKRILAGSRLLYGPDFTAAEHLSIEPEQVEFTPAAEPPKRKPIVSKLPVASLESKHLQDARVLCDYLAQVRREKHDLATRSTNPCLEAADRLLRVNKMTLDEGKAMVDFLADRNALVKWVTNADDLYWHADEVLTNGGFRLWLTSTGVQFNESILDAAAFRIANPTSGHQAGRGGAGAGKPGATMSSPQGVRDAEHGTGGRRSIAI